MSLHSCNHMFRDVSGRFPESGRMGSSCISQGEEGLEQGRVGHNVSVDGGGQMDLTTH